jgi:hypothetical protein
MTKYILHGGETKIENGHNANFFRELIKGNSKILLCYFASAEDVWLKKFNQDMNRIQALDKNKHIEFMMANPQDFAEQVDWADAIYFRGGSGHLMRDILSGKISKDNLKDKIVAGSSAGVNVLAKYYYDQDYRTIEEGLGILPIKTITHFGEGSKYPADYEKIKKDLKNYKEDLEVIALPETEFIIKEIK